MFIGIGESGEIINFFADETDLLILLLVHLHDKQVYLTDQDGSFRVQDIWDTLSQMEKKCFFFSYVFSGCDSVSCIFGVGKAQFLKLVAGKLPEEILTVFQNPHSSIVAIKAAGIKVFQFLSTKGKRYDFTLDKIRCQKYIELSGKGRLQPERLGPTTGAAEMHALRVFWQLQEWSSLISLEPALYGWKKSENKFIPIGTLKEIAPGKLLQFVVCKCEKGCTGKCSCVANNVKCVQACSHCRGILCENRATESLSSNESDDSDDEYY